MARVLVVSDEPDVLLRARIELERAGHEAVLAADAEQAAERLAEAEVDVVVAATAAVPVGDLRVPTVHLPRPFVTEALLAAVAACG